MEDRVVVKVVRRYSRRQYVLRWKAQGKSSEHVAKAKWGDEAAAFREAFEIEERLNNPSAAILTWDYATMCYEEWHLVHYSYEHMKSWRSAKKRFIEWAKDSPPDVPKIDNTTLAQFAADLSRQVALDTARGYCQYLGSFLQWCYDQEWIDRVPRVKLPRRKKGEKRSKGRPLTTEEFDRMVAAIPHVVNEQFVPSWEFLIRGLWETSLRLGEALKLHWSNEPVRLNLDGKYPMIDFEVEGHKGRTTTQLPVTREFAEMVEALPRRGYVFRPLLSRGVTRSESTWSHKIGDFGRKARILVDENKRTEKKKFASAHDLRRSFLDRWKSRVDATVLQILARHESLDTTQQYYLGEQAEQVAKAIWGTSE